MFKCSSSVTFILTLLAICDCLYAGDSCVVEDRPGSCKLLSQCEHLIAEIRNAGSPMPARLRIKLQGLSCGFQGLDPLICCATPFTNDNLDVVTSYPSWTPMVHGMGGGAVDPWPTPGNQATTSEPRGPVNRYPDTNPSDTDDYHKPGPGTKNSIPNVNSGPPDIQRPRNLDLLPSDCGPFSDDYRVWGGNRTRLFEMPWMVLISYDSPRGRKLSCGGTLITERYVMTAAHCVSFLGNRLTLQGVVVGEYDTNKDPDCERMDGELHCAPNVQNVAIENVIAHPGYSPQNLYDDIALVKLAEPVDFTQENVKPICLPDTPELLSNTMEGQTGTVAGWGATEDGLQSSILLKVDLPIVSNKDCQDAYNGSPRIYNRQMCAGGVEDKDSCGGDSGGPLLSIGRTRTGRMAFVQQGIVSYGSKRCGIGGFPGVYTRVAYYMDWILDHIAD